MKAPLLSIALAVAAAGCDLPETTNAYSFDFTGMILPTDVAGPGIPISNTSAWLGPTARDRFAIPSDASVSDPEARTDVASRIVSALVRERLEVICSSPLDALSDSEILVSQQLCTTVPGAPRRPREHCLQLTQVLAASMPGTGLALPPLDAERPAACGSTSVRFTDRPVDDSGALTLRVASAPTALTASLGEDRVEFELGRGRYRSVVIESRSVVPLDVSDAVRIEAGGCPFGVSPAVEAPDACRIVVLVSVRDPSAAPRTIAVRTRVRTIDERGRSATFTLAAATTLGVRCGILDISTLRTDGRVWRTAVSSASVFLRPLQPTFARDVCVDAVSGAYDPELELLVDGVQVTSWARLEPGPHVISLRRAMFFRDHQQPLLTRQGFGTTELTLSSGACR